MIGDRLGCKSLERRRIVTLSDVMRGRFLGEVVEYVLRQPHRYIFEQGFTAVGDGTGFATGHEDSEVGIPGGHAQGRYR